MKRKAAFKNIALVANVKKAAVRHAVAQLHDFCQEWGIGLSAEAESLRSLKIPGIRALSREALAKKSDLIISLGGDGTMLNSARLAAPKDIPVFGVNMGTLGFITSVPYEHFQRSLKEVLEGHYKLLRRSMLLAEIFRRGRRVERRIALNDVVLLRGSSAKLAELETRIDGRVMATYRADGLIVATPTGSTAYALSAGAPVLEPNSPTLVLAPISPHTLSVRPVVISDRSVIEIEAPRTRSPLSFSSDGETGFWLKAEDRIRLSRYEHDALLLVSPDYDYWEVLRGKLGWRGN
jgi:NAD+ kinase